MSPSNRSCWELVEFSHDFRRKIFRKIQYTFCLMSVNEGAFSSTHQRFEILTVRFDPLKSCFGAYSRSKIFSSFISNSEKRMEKEKQTENKFVNFFLKISTKNHSMTVFNERTEFALSSYKWIFLKFKDSVSIIFFICGNFRMIRSCQSQRFVLNLRILVHTFTRHYIIKLFWIK